MVIRVVVWNKWKMAKVNPDGDGSVEEEKKAKKGKEKEGSD